jgi:plasmid stabilization system protein ParE
LKSLPRQAKILDVILEWLVAHDASDAGLRWFRGMKEAIASLSQHPESAEFAFEVRQLLYGSKRHAYRILFCIEAEVVVVHHIRHGPRQPL